MKTVEHKTILIVEDSEPLSRELRDYFSVANEVHAASTLEAASEAVKNNAFDIILLDLILPDGSGLSLFEEIGADTPVVILSDLGSDENILKGIDCGAADYIVKPASPRVIEARMALRLLPPKEARLVPARHAARHEHPHRLLSKPPAGAYFERIQYTDVSDAECRRLFLCNRHL